MKLYQIHCGFYDTNLCQGIYETHINLFVIAENFDAAREEVRKIPEFRAKKMHIDGMQELSRINGYELQFVRKSDSETILIPSLHRDF